MNALDDLPVVVIGAGPVGLAAAAHLHERGLPFIVLEAGDGPAAAVRQWGHVRLFSPWRYNIDAAARRLLADAGWVAPDPEALPTGARARRRLPAAPRRPAAAQAARALRRPRRGRHPARPGPAAHRRARHRPRSWSASPTATTCVARAVIDASGTWTTPNVLGASGICARAARPTPRRTSKHALPDVLGADRDRFAGRHTLVVGAGHSAANTLLSLAELAAVEPGTEVTWAIRAAAPARTYGGGTPTRSRPGARSAPGCVSTSTPAAIRLLTGFSVQALTPRTAGSSVACGTATAAPSRHRRPDRSPPPASAPTTASPPSCGWTSTRCWAPPAPWPR